MQRRFYGGILERVKGLFKAEQPASRQLKDAPVKQAGKKDAPIKQMAKDTPLINTIVTPAARLALLHRLGWQDKVPVETLSKALLHPALQHAEGDPRVFLRLLEKGQSLLDQAVREHIKNTWPCLPVEQRELARRMYTADSNLRTMAMSLGIPHALLPYRGPPLMHQVPLTELTKGETTNVEKDKTKKKNKTAATLLEEREAAQASKVKSNAEVAKIYAEVFKALLGTLKATEVPPFLAKTLFTATFDVNQLVNPAQPVLLLSRLLGKESRTLTFRLHHESGRLSNDAIYVVGAYAGNELLGEADGPSLHVAQHRAALNSLRKRWLAPQ